VLDQKLPRLQRGCGWLPAPTACVLNVFRLRPLEFLTDEVLETGGLLELGFYAH
jgi:hypothetical protein